jgi:hypothetical protein
MVMGGCTKFLEGKLKLKVNRKKSTAGSPTKLKFLGFSLYTRKGQVRIRDHGMDTERTDNPLSRMVRILRYRGPKMAYKPNHCMVTTAYTTTFLETMETDKNQV